MKTRKKISSNGTLGKLIKKCKSKDIHHFITKQQEFKKIEFKANNNLDRVG
jgi:hypothetical protein